MSLEKLLSGQIVYMEKQGYSMYTASFGAYNHKNHIQISHLRRAINPVQDMLALVELIWQIHKLKPTIVHTHTPKAGLLGMCAAWFCRVPVRMHTVAGLPLMEKKGLLYKLLVVMERFTYAFSSSIHPNSLGLLQYIRENISKSKKISIIGRGTSNGINLNIFNPNTTNIKAKQQLELEYQLKDKLVFIFIGRMVRDKGIVEAVNAFVKLNEDQKDTVLILVGPLEPELDPLPQSTITTINTHTAIHLVGFQSDVRPFIAVSDILVFPSYREGFPNVPLQCGAFKKALILSNINGCNEIIKHNQSGLLVEPKSESEVFDAMRFLADSAEKRSKFGDKVYTFIRENFKQEEV